MKTSRLRFTIIIFLILFITIFGITLLKNDNQNNDYKYNGAVSENVNNEFELKSATAINQTLIFQNVTTLRRGFESINFTINASEFTYANEAKMRIAFSNNSDSTFNMTLQSGTLSNFTIAYSPSGSAPLGIQIVSFEIFNASGLKLNDGSTQRTFRIISTSMISFNNTEYLRGEYLLADLNDISDNFDWDLSVVNSTNESQQKELFRLGHNVLQVNFEINDSFIEVNKDYFIEVDLEKISTPRTTKEYFKFFVRNTDPLIIQSSVIFNPISVFRTQDCTISLNVTDVEYTAPDIDVLMILEDPNGNILPTESLDNNLDDSFTKSFSISASRPAGNYRVRFNASDPQGDIGEFSTLLTVKNNPPDIDSYEINDIDTDERISVLYGEDLVFEFDVFDEEGISYITVLLIDQDDEEYEISREYEDDLEITVRTEDLVTGTWTVYVSVTDIDGETTKLDSDFDTGPQEIEIVPNLLDDVLPWIMFLIGLGIGIIGVIVTALAKRKPKVLESEISKEKIISKKKAKKTKKPAKEKPEQVKKEPIKKEAEPEPEKVEDREPKTIAPKRKIKRRLR